MTKQRSPAAQAVLDATFSEYGGAYCEALYSLTEEQHASKIAAAALRALADQVAPERLLCTRTAEERTLYHEGRLDAAIRFRAEILDIATELEALPNDYGERTMSRTFSIVCDDCKQSLWIGQGWPDKPKSLTLYYGDQKIMAKLQSFLFAHVGHSLRFVDDEELCNSHEDLSNYD